jgi:hypothetical protein
MSIPQAWMLFFALPPQLQVVYEVVWLIFYVLPCFRSVWTRKEIHWGIAGSFLLIVMLYPVVIPWRALFPQ